MSITTEQTKEIMDRMRRMETRMTRWLESQGFDTQTKRPVWDRRGVIHVPSMACSMRDLLDVIPPTWPVDDTIDVHHHGEYIMNLRVPETTMPEGAI